MCLMLPLGDSPTHSGQANQSNECVMARMGRVTGEKGSGDPLTHRDQWPNPWEGLNKEWENWVAHCRTTGMETRISYITTACHSIHARIGARRNEE